MSGDVSLELWRHEYKMTALNRALEESGTDTQTVMQAHMEYLYHQYVPAQERTNINNRIEGERLADERRAEENRRVSVFHVAEQGEECYFMVEEGLELLDAAKRLRSYLAKSPSVSADRFVNLFTHPEIISAEEFDALVGIRMENTGRVTGAFDVNFDKREFSAVNIMDGWKTFAMGDVSAAAYHATRKQYLFPDQQYARLLEKLDGREITSAGHLSGRSISFSEEILEMDECLNFYMDTTFDVDAAFGANVCTAENDDWLNVYANYDLSTGQVCDALELELHRGDGAEDTLQYQLNAAEKEVLLQKMDQYCQAQNGLSLEKYREQFLLEQHESPDGPTMNL